MRDFLYMWGSVPFLAVGQLLSGMSKYVPCAVEENVVPAN